MILLCDIECLNHHVNSEMPAFLCRLSCVVFDLYNSRPARKTKAEYRGRSSVGKLRLVFPYHA